MVSIDALEDAKLVLDTFYNRGYREIDTSANYISSEKRLGETGAASRFTIHTKVFSLTPGDHEPANVVKSINQSLKDLRTSSVETVMLHVADRQTPFEATAKALNDAYQDGKFKRWGFSSYTADEVKRYIDICEEKGYVKPTVYEGQYNAVVRGFEEELFPLLREHNIAFFAFRYVSTRCAVVNSTLTFDFSPAAGGLFTDHTSTSDRWIGNVRLLSSPPRVPTMN